MDRPATPPLSSRAQGVPIPPSARAVLTPKGVKGPSQHPQVPKPRPSICVRCRKPSDKICSVCKATYCGPICQHLDWAKHRFLCRAFVTKFAPQNRPSPHHWRCVYLPCNRRDPRVIWWDASRNIWDLFKSPEETMGYMAVADILRENPSHDYSDKTRKENQVMIVGNFITKGSQKKNRTIQGLAPIGHMFPWEGAVLIANWMPGGLEFVADTERERGLNIPQVVWSDVSVMDFGWALDCFRWHPYNASMADFDRYPLPRLSLFGHKLSTFDLPMLVRGVKLSCNWDMDHVKELPVIDEVIFPLKDPADEEDIIDIPSIACQRLELPINLRVSSLIADELPTEKECTAVMLANKYASFLHLEDFEQKDDEFIMYATSSRGFGNILVYRTDQKYLPMVHVAAIAAFLEQVLRSKNVMIGGRTIGDTFEAVPFLGPAYRRMVTKEAFQEFWVAFNAEGVKAGLKSFPSPYDMRMA